MQTAVDCNGSNSTTTTTTSNNSNNSNIIDNTKHHNQQSQHPQPQPQQQSSESVLINRLLAGKIINSNNNTATGNAGNSQVSHSYEATSFSSSGIPGPGPGSGPGAGIGDCLLGSPSKDSTTKSKLLSQFTRKIPTSMSVTGTATATGTAELTPTATSTLTATTPTSYFSCNSSPASTPSAASPPTAATIQPSIPVSVSKTTQQSSTSSESYTSVGSTTNATTTTTTSTTVTTTSTTTKTNVGSRSKYEYELLEWKDMPKYLQFNPYVLNGYRPLTTFKGCLLSLFYWHNETINILTHAIPIFYILAVVPGLMPWENGYRFLSFCHVFGSLAPWCGSFVYHLFMNIEKGEDVYYRLLKLDMVGIWVSQSFGALPLVTATTLCFTFKWKWCIIISYCLLSLWGLYKALTASSPWQRRLCFALPFTMRSILTFLRTIGIVGSNRITMSHVYLQLVVDGVSILGGAIGAMRIPEKWFPGLVDYYLNSHNIMHVLVVVAVYSMHQATIRELAWMSTAQCGNGGSMNVTNEIIDTTSTVEANAEL